MAVLTGLFVLTGCTPENDPASQGGEGVALDIILHNGHILTVDRDFSTAQALAISGDKLVSVGSNEEITPLKGANTRVIDLKGATVIPGINDSHLHLLELGMTISQIDLRGKGIGEIKDSLAKRVAQSKPGEVIRGEGWTKDSIGRMPTREDIDSLSPHNPVVFDDMTRHALWVNSKMLELAGITRETEDPVGIRLERDPVSGEPTGVLHEGADLILPHIPVLSDAAKKQAIVDAIEVLNRQGVTSITEPGVKPEDAAIYEQLADEGKLSARVNVHIGGGRSLQQAKKGVAAYAEKSKNRGTTQNLMTLRGVKLFMDGAPPGRTAATFDDYACCPGEKGLLLYQGETEEQQREEVFNSIEWLHREGYQLGVHATGDRSADIAIEGLIRAMEQFPVNPAAPKSNALRHYLIHGDMVKDEDIERMAEWNIGLSTQPLITHYAGHVLQELWGPDKGARHMATSLFLKAGVWASISTDGPVVPPDWKQNLEYAVLRESEFLPDRVNGPQYRISIEDALIAHTRTPAYQDFQEDVKGTIEPGKFADLVVLDQDILTIDPDRISDIKTLMTIVGGRVVYEDFPIPGNN